MKKIKGVKKAVSEYNSWMSGQGKARYAYIMYDKNTGEVWTDVYDDLGRNTWDEYHDKSIINISGILNEWGLKTSMQNIKECIDWIENQNNNPNNNLC